MPQYEIALSVEDYDGDFDECAEATDDARTSFLIEAKELGVNVEVITSIEFVEFDSSNPSHAAGYFLVTYVGDEFPEENDQ